MNTIQQFQQDIISYKIDEVVSRTLADLQSCDDEGFNFCDNCLNIHCPMIYPNRICKVWQLMEINSG